MKGILQLEMICLNKLQLMKEIKQKNLQDIKCFVCIQKIENVCLA